MDKAAELQRLALVEGKIAKCMQRREKMKPSGAKDRLSRWIGCLAFTRLGIESRLREDG